MDRFTAEFQPEAWINDVAVPVDPEGPTRWDCTEWAAENAAYIAECARRRGENLVDPWGVTDNDDVFRHDPAAPEWVREWRGPFTIRLTYTVAPELDGCTALECTECGAAVGQPCEIWCIADQATP